ncbi:preprotein translocase subunit SecA [Candidatus Magnetaquicoccus inordinatus]|uniref:preprotein translocase subunit SecA n=1 Tax=Candidatus Magnetaquicoccus inordinatus TaxID=2496818 RepID=UPI00102CAD37|nr:preprotein translocase subunit SecA [Candidatus Magnetaquicoccus inordinatus]
MFSTLARKIFGSRNDRYLRKLQGVIDQINSLEADLEKLSDDALRGQTDLFKRRLQEGETVDDLLPEAFAVVREASKRVLGMRHFDTQLLGGLVLHQGKIAEMRTGEGKTLVATLPLYLNALTGKGVHLVTVNDYLAQRDAAWMGKIYRFLGMSVGVIIHGLDDDERREAYNSDITYGTNNEFGFDFLRDNMKFTVAELVQRPLHYAIVDEVDSILIDEARTPLIISGPTEDNTDKYYRVDRLIPHLQKLVHFTIDEKSRTVVFTEEGSELIENLLIEKGIIKSGNLYDIGNVETVHHVNQALRAHALFEKDRDYIVKDGEVVIIDEFTGRMMPGRRYSDGLHQALEAKEHVIIQNESQTLASITFQNLFRLYNKLAGMTGTADTEASEFESIYRLEVIILPTHRPMIRIDHDDVVYRTHEEKLVAIIEEVRDCFERGQPVLVGTISIEKSEELSKRLRKEKIQHTVLNAKYHEKEAEIVAQAGRKGAVTIATNMAGRGTDIQLGGNPDMRIAREIAENVPEEERPALEAAIRAECAAEKAEVIALGGLHILSSERHEARRIDNQLRGRSGRQGDPGSSRFYLSLQDDLMRIFGSERMDGMLQKLGLQEGEAIIHPWINRAIESAQKKVEGRNFDIRKNLLKYDDVMNEQRKVVYEQRLEIMQQEDLADYIESIREELLDALVAESVPETALPEDWQLDLLQANLLRQFGVHINGMAAWRDEDGVTSHIILERARQAMQTHIQEREERLGATLMRYLEKSILLQVLDSLWKEHLLNMDHLKEGIHLRGYAQKDPLNEYKREAFQLFDGMLNRIKEEVVEILCRIEVSRQEEVEELEAERAAQRDKKLSMHHPSYQEEDEEGSPGESDSRTPYRREGEKVGRNAPCPCGSGKKYKQCCGQLA